MPSRVRAVREYLRSTHFLDHDTPAVREFTLRSMAGAIGARESAVRLFYAVRDGIRYDPYSVSLDPQHYRASVITGAAAGFCVPKAILLAAAGRAAGVPTRLGFADVRNHLSSERLFALLGTDVFAFHGYTELWLEGRWLKATPAFNRELCARFGVAPLEFDGTSDAMFQAFDARGRRHMEYLRDRGTFADFPFEEMVRAFRDTYPGLEVEDLRRCDDQIFSNQVVD